MPKKKEKQITPFKSRSPKRKKSSKLKKTPKPSRPKDTPQTLLFFRDLLTKFAKEADPKKQVKAIQVIERMRSRERGKKEGCSDSLLSESLYDALTEVFIKALKAPSESDKRQNAAKTDKSGLVTVTDLSDLGSKPKPQKESDACKVLKRNTLTLAQRSLIANFTKEFGVEFKQTVSDADLCAKLRSTLGFHNKSK